MIKSTRCLFALAKHSSLVNQVVRQKSSHILGGNLLRCVASPRLSSVCVRSVQTKSDKELSDFLDKEIREEMKIRKNVTPPAVDGFEIKSSGSELTLTKKLNDETITVTLNVNHSVDAEDPENLDPTQDEAPNVGEMKSKPDFSVEIAKGGQILLLHCSIPNDMQDEDEQQRDDSYNDAFQITEMSLYEGELKESTYSVSGGIMDGYLYDLLMNMLDERGITDEFVDALIQHCTSFENNLYINLLQNLKNFVTK